MFLHVMKFKDIARVNVNKANNQVSLNLKALQLRKLNLTPTQIMEMTIPKPKIKKLEPKFTKIKLKGGFK